MTHDLDKLGDYTSFEIVHNGNLYRATLERGMYADYPFQLYIECVDWDTRQRFPEFSNAYKTAKAALNKLAHYWKGETVEWRRL